MCSGFGSCSEVWGLEYVLRDELQRRSAFSLQESSQELRNSFPTLGKELLSQFTHSVKALIASNPCFLGPGPWIRLLLRFCCPDMI